MVDRRHRNVAFLVAGCMFMEILDGTIVVTAAPRIGDALRVSPSAIGLVVTAYLVTVAALIPLSAWLTRRLGYRAVFLSAIVVFTLASVGCALSAGVWELVGWRVLQGVGGAMMVPVGRMVVFDGAETSQIMRLTAYVVWPALLAPVLAPLVGGAIVTYASWRWLFLVNVPLGVVALGCALRLVANRPQEAPPALDLAGVVLTVGGLGGVPVVAHLVSEQRPPWAAVAVAAAATAVLLACAVRHLLRVAAPLLDLRTLRIPTYGNALGGAALMQMVIGSIPFLLALLFQVAFHWSPVKSGAVVMAVFVGNVGAKPMTTFLYGRLGFRRVLTACTAVSAAAALLCGALTAGTPAVATLALLVVSGMARSVSMTGYWTLAFGDVPDERMRDANALLSTSQQLFSGLAVAVATMALRLGDPLGALVPGREDARSPFVVAFVVVAALAACATAVARRLHVRAGAALTAPA
ncbi:MAG TPA: MFS transporter [Solirubrobacteraceae bacterium]|nr:MFS transporter [Solirubrobacteraceae bacterium]